MNWFHPHLNSQRADQSIALILGLLGLILIRFFWIQVVGADEFTLQSTENRLRRVILPAPRGIIVDRNGVVIAENVPGFTVAIHAATEEVLRRTLDSIMDLAGLDSTATAGAVQRWRVRPGDPVTVLRDAPPEVVAQLEERRVTFPGLVIQAGPKRSYPSGSLAAHAIGYLSQLTTGDLEENRFPGARSGSLVGRVGLEFQYDARLRGVDGEGFIEVDAMGRTVRTSGVGRRVEPRQGDTLHTTLDIDLQRYIVRLFRREFGIAGRGAVMAIDPRDGAVLALHSAPSYDPNVFIGSSGSEERGELLRSPQQPLFNRAIQGRYPPASPWKLAVAVMALQKGLITMDTKMQIPCTGGYQYGNRFFRCWKTDGHGSLTLFEAIQHSCDVYFYQLGIMLGLDDLLAGGVELGFRDLTGIDLPGEQRSIFPASTEYFDERYGRRGWTLGVTLNLAIGQGENDQTLINMMRFYAMLANGGTAPVPYLVDSFPAGRRTFNFREGLLANLRESLEQVVQEGTARSSQIANLRIGGKTGTAQNPHGKDHGWFVAFSPVDDPVVLVGAIVEFAEHGSSIAPMVNCIVARYIIGPGFDCPRRGLRLADFPSDSAPEPFVVLTDIRRGRLR